MTTDFTAMASAFLAGNPTVEELVELLSQVEDKAFSLGVDYERDRGCEWCGNRDCTCFT